jgi:hypothetical protein
VALLVPPGDHEVLLATQTGCTVEARLEEARVRSGELGGGGEAELTALREEVGDLRRDLGELQERMDFTERMLTQARETEPLPGGDQS